MPNCLINTTRPPRKKACNGCTKSKVRCTLEKPICTRCQLTGRTCQYPAWAPVQGSSPTDTSSTVNPGASYSGAPSFATPHQDPTPEVPIPLPYAPTPSSGVYSPSIQFQRPVASDWRDTHSVDFTAIDLVPCANADDIRDRWLRPYILPPLGADEIPKVYHPFTIQYISRVLSTYPRCMLKDKGIPPMIHSAQVDGMIPRALANCYNLVRMWEQAVPGSEVMVVDTLEKEMERLSEEVLVL